MVEFIAGNKIVSKNGVKLQEVVGNNWYSRQFELASIQDNLKLKENEQFILTLKENKRLLEI